MQWRSSVTLCCIVWSHRRSNTVGGWNTVGCLLREKYKNELLTAEWIKLDEALTTALTHHTEYKLGLFISKENVSIAVKNKLLQAAATIYVERGHDSKLQQHFQ